MDVAYNKSGASSRAHYQIVRSVENASEQTEELLAKDVQRVRQHITSKNLSNSEIRKELIVLLYCFSTSSGAVNAKTLAFALPSAVHLAEAGVKVSEKHVGYMFCSEVMPRGHELELMMVNTIRKDITSSSFSRIILALEFLVSSPFEDVIPAVHTRCADLLSHPSARVKILAMHALHSLACFAPDVLHEEKVKKAMVERMSDGDESVVRAALKVCLSLAKDVLLRPEDVLERCMALLDRIADKQDGAEYPPIFRIAILSALADLLSESSINASDYAKRIIPPLFRILRRSVRSDSHSIIFGCFRLLGKLPSPIVTKYIIARSQAPASATASPSSATSRRLTQPVHPVAMIRHFLSSRELNERYLFLSCLTYLDPSIWAVAQMPDKNENDLLAAEVSSAQLRPPSLEKKLEPVLDQWEVERVLLSLESDDEGIRALTLRILISMDPSLVESCYERALEALRGSVQNGSQEKKVEKNARAVAALAQRALELAFTVSTETTMREEKKSIGRMIQDITDALKSNGKVVSGIVQVILNYARNLSASAQRELLLDLFAVMENSNTTDDTPETQPINATFLLAFLALMTELGPSVISVTSQIRKIVHGLAFQLSNHTGAMQEPMLLTMTRLVLLLPPIDLSAPQIEYALQTITDLQSNISFTSSPRKANLLSKRIGQFKQAVRDPNSILSALESKDISSLPSFALLLEQASVSPPLDDPKEEPVPLAQSPRVKSPTSLTHSKLRYDAYEPPSTSASLRIGRKQNLSPRSKMSELKVLRSPSSASVSTATGRDVGDRTPGASTPLESVPSTGTPTGISVDPLLSASLTDIIDEASSSKVLGPLIALDSPFIAEPLVDVKESTLSNSGIGTPPYVSANTSLRASPEPKGEFEELWNVMAVDERVRGSRGWYDGSGEDAVRQLQSLGLKMDVVSEDVDPFIGELKISLRSPSFGDGEGPDIRGLLRLHEEDDGSCLWQAKCEDIELGSKLKDLLR